MCYKAKRNLGYIKSLFNIVDNYQTDIMFYVKMVCRFNYLLFWITYYSLNYTINEKIVKYIFYLPNHSRLDLIENITKTLESVNIVYVKVFQSVCLDKNYLHDNEKDYLIKYTDSVPFNTDEVDYDLLNKIENEFEIEVYYDKPLNSGIIGVVFPGYYKKYDKKIVVKMLKKNIEQNLITFFKEIHIIGYFLRYIPFINLLNIDKIINDNRELLIGQLDFMRELTNMEIFKDKNKMFDFLTVPTGYREITECYNNIIVMDDIKGLTIRDVKNMSREIKEEFGELIMKIGMNSILFTGANHNDLHSGNIFFYISSKQEIESGLPKYRIGLIDFGICNYIEGKEQSSYFYFFYNICFQHVYDNYEKNVESLIIIIEEKDKFLKLDKNIQELIVNNSINIIDEYFKDKTDFGIVCGINILKIFKKYGFTFSKNFNKCILSLNCINTIGIELCTNPLVTQNKVVNELVKDYEYINNLIKID